MGCRMALSIPWPSTYLVVFLPLLIQLQTFCTNICSEAQHWVEAQFDALFLSLEECLVDQRYRGIKQLICPT